MTAEGSSCPDGLVCTGGRCRTDALAPACPQGSIDAGDDPDPADARADVDAIDAFVADADPLAPDAAPVPDASADAGCTCDPLAQSCCAASDACDVAGADSYCRDVSTAGLQAAVCSGPTQCARGYTCVSSDGTPPGSCHEFCDADGDCAGGGGLCDLIAGTGASATQVCTSACNPLTASGCPGAACTVQPNVQGTRWHTDCRPAGAGAVGADCTDDDGCQVGLACAGSPLRCRTYCDRDASGGSACPGTPICTALGPGDGAVIGGVEWGVCI